MKSSYLHKNLSGFFCMQVWLVICSDEQFRYNKDTCHEGFGRSLLSISLIKRVHGFIIVTTTDKFFDASLIIAKIVDIPILAMLSWKDPGWFGVWSHDDPNIDNLNNHGNTAVVVSCWLCAMLDVSHSFIKVRGRIVGL